MMVISKKPIFQLSKHSLQLNTRDLFYNEVGDVVDERTAQRRLSIEKYKEVLEVLVQDLVQAVLPVEPDGEPMNVYQHNDNDAEIETLKS